MSDDKFDDDRSETSSVKKKQIEKKIYGVLFLKVMPVVAIIVGSVSLYSIVYLETLSKEF